MTLLNLQFLSLLNPTNSSAISQSLIISPIKLHLRPLPSSISLNYNQERGQDEIFRAQEEDLGEDGDVFKRTLRLVECSMFAWVAGLAYLLSNSLSLKENIRRCVCIIYDPARSNALKLSDSFMELYRKNNFSGEKLRKKKLSWVDIFEEIPACSHLPEIQEADIPCWNFSCTRPKSSNVPSLQL